MRDIMDELYIEELKEEISRLTTKVKDYEDACHQKQEILYSESAEVKRLTAENERLKEQLKAQGEPYGWFIQDGMGCMKLDAQYEKDAAHYGAFPLYAAPPVREGWVSVPRTPTPEILEHLSDMLTNCHSVRESYEELISIAEESCTR